MRYCSRTDVGKVREKNEDVLFADGRLFAVADGMGGHSGGEVASATAMKMVAEAVRATPGDENVARLLAGVIVSANEEIYHKSHSATGPSGMGTTLTAGVLAGQTLTIGHVGDSRAYLLRGGAMSQLTQDHSLVGELVRSGEITREAAFHHPNRNLLTKALGTSEDITADISTHTLQPCDKVLFTTDGLTSTVTEQRIAEILAAPEDAAAVCEKLVAGANAAGGTDNISVVLLDFSDGKPFEQVKPVGTKGRGAGAGRTSTRGGCGRLAAIVLVPVAILALLAAVAAYRVVTTTYYLGLSDNGRVTIFQGFPGSFMGLSYSKIYEETAVTRDVLLPHEVQPILDNRIVGDLAEIRSIAARLKRATTPSKPLPPGRPPVPGQPPAEPTPTPQPI